MLCTENSKKEPMKTGLPTEETVQRWLIKAEKGHAMSQYNLGISYYKGVGIPKDWNKALYWFKAAGVQGVVSR